VKKRLITLLATPFAAATLLLGAGATPAAAAVDPTPSTTTPDGKTIELFEFVYTYKAILTPAQAGDSAWVETYIKGGTPTVTGKVTASADVAALYSGSVSFAGPFLTLRACAQTGAGVTCTAWNKAI
jgi:hypothetical protein